MGKLSESGGQIKTAIASEDDTNFVSNAMLAYLENPPVAINGEDGIDAYEVAVVEGYLGSRAQWLTSLVGPSGNGSASFSVQPFVIDLANPVYGYVTDYTDNSNVGTDNLVAINLAIAAAVALASSNQYVLVHFPAGQAYVSDYIPFPKYVFPSASGGANLFTDINDGLWNESFFPVGDVNVRQEGMQFSLPHIEHINWWNNHKFRPSAINYKGFQIINLNRFDMTFRDVQGFYQVGEFLATGAGSPSESNLVSYATVTQVGRSATYKYGIRVHGQEDADLANLPGWVNEITFNGLKMQPNSNMRKYGSTFDFVFSASPNGYKSQNNHKVFTASFEPGSSWLEWAASTDYNTEYTRVKASNGHEYLISGTGTSGTNEPVHTNGETISDGGLSWTEIGKFKKCPVWHDGAGSYNLFFGCRHETGYGGFAHFTGDIVKGNHYNFYTAADPDTGAIPGVIRHIEDYNNADVTTMGGYGLSNTCDVYSQAVNKTDMQFTLDNMHLRAVGSAAGMTIAGSAHSYLYANPTEEWPVVPAQGKDVLCFDGVVQLGHEDGAGSFRGIWVDVSKMKRFIAEVATEDYGRWYIRGYDQDFNFVNATDANMHLRADGGMIGLSTNKGVLRSPANVNHPMIATVSDDSPIKYIFVSYQGAKISSINIKMLPDNLSAKGNCEVLIPHGDSEDQRKCYGAPTLGIFQKPGEFIQNLNTSTEQVFGWRVKTKGYLSPQFVASETKIKGQLSSSLGRHYYAVSPGVQTSTLPTHTSGTVNGLTYVGVDAVLIPSSETY